MDDTAAARALPGSVRRAQVLAGTKEGDRRMVGFRLKKLMTAPNFLCAAILSLQFVPDRRPDQWVLLFQGLLVLLEVLYLAYAIFGREKRGFRQPATCSQSSSSSPAHGSS